MRIFIFIYLAATFFCSTLLAAPTPNAQTRVSEFIVKSPTLISQRIADSWGWRRMDRIESNDPRAGGAGGDGGEILKKQPLDAAREDLVLSLDNKSSSVSLLEVEEQPLYTDRSNLSLNRATINIRRLLPEKRKEHSDVIHLETDELPLDINDSLTLVASDRSNTNMERLDLEDKLSSRTRDTVVTGIPEEKETDNLSFGVKSGKQLTTAKDRILSGERINKKLDLSKAFDTTDSNSVTNTETTSGSPNKWDAFVSNLDLLNYDYDYFNYIYELDLMRYPDEPDQHTNLKAQGVDNYLKPKKTGIGGEQNTQHPKDINNIINTKQQVNKDVNINQLTDKNTVGPEVPNNILLGTTESAPSQDSIIKQLVKIVGKLKIKPGKFATIETSNTEKDTIYRMNPTLNEQGHKNKKTVEIESKVSENIPINQDPNFTAPTILNISIPTLLERTSSPDKMLYVPATKKINDISPSSNNIKTKLNLNNKINRTSSSTTITPTTHVPTTISSHHSLSKFKPTRHYVPTTTISSHPSSSKIIPTTTHSVPTTTISSHPSASKIIPTRTHSVPTTTISSHPSSSKIYPTTHSVPTTTISSHPSSSKIKPTTTHSVSTTTISSHPSSSKIIPTTTYSVPTTTISSHPSSSKIKPTTHSVPTNTILSHPSSSKIIPTITHSVPTTIASHHSLSKIKPTTHYVPTTTISSHPSSSTIIPTTTIKSHPSSSRITPITTTTFKPHTTSSAPISTTVTDTPSILTHIQSLPNKATSMPTTTTLVPIIETSHSTTTLLPTTTIPPPETSPNKDKGWRKESSFSVEIRVEASNSRQPKSISGTTKNSMTKSDNIKKKNVVAEILNQTVLSPYKHTDSMRLRDVLVLDVSGTPKTVEINPSLEQKLDESQPDNFTLVTNTSKIEELSTNGNHRLRRPTENRPMERKLPGAYVYNLALKKKIPGASRTRTNIPRRVSQRKNTNVVPLYLRRQLGLNPYGLNPSGSHPFGLSPHGIAPLGLAPLGGGSNITNVTNTTITTTPLTPLNTTNDTKSSEIYNISSTNLLTPSAYTIAPSQDSTTNSQTSPTIQITTPSTTTTLSSTSATQSSTTTILPPSTTTPIPTTTKPREERLHVQVRKPDGSINGDYIVQDHHTGQFSGVRYDAVDGVDQDFIQKALFDFLSLGSNFEQKRVRRDTLLQPQIIVMSQKT